MSLIRSAQRNGHDPYVYLRDVRKRPDCTVKVAVAVTAASQIAANRIGSGSRRSMVCKSNGMHQRLRTLRIAHGFPG